MRTWVTGATGQIGSRLCIELARVGHEVTAISSRPAPSTSLYQWVQWDMSRDSFDVRNVLTPDVVFHLAAQTSAYQARQDLPADVTTNLLGFIRLLDALRQTDSSPHVFLTGAATEVGATSSGIIRDSDPDDPKTFYDVSKVAQNLYLKQCTSEGWVEGTTIRLPNVYGGVGSDALTERGFLNQSIRRALLGEDLRYYSDGEYIRDFLHVDDVVNALMSAMNHRMAVVGQTFLIGTGTGTRIREALAEVARQAEQITGTSVHLVDAIPPVGMYDIERRNVVVDSLRFRDRTRWEPNVSLEEGIRRTIRDTTELS